MAIEDWHTLSEWEVRTMAALSHPGLVSVFRPLQALPQVVGTPFVASRSFTP